LLSLVFCVIFVAVGASHLVADKPAAAASSIMREVDHVLTSTMNQSIVYPLEEMAKFDSKNIKEKFKCLFPMLRDEILEIMKRKEMTDEAIEWVKNMMDYNVPGGKLNRGTTVVSVVRTLKGRSLTDEEIAKASVLGWAIEFLQAFFLVADDVMDESQTRRGQPCWYKVPKVQLIAINDSFILENFVFTLLKQHFGKEPYYYLLVELFLDVIQNTEFGQLLDLTTQPIHSTMLNTTGSAAPPVDLTRFTLKRYEKIVKYKTAFYSFYLPIAMGMITSEITDAKAYETARNICCIMGEYFQITDDVLDCYGDPAVIGKIGTDIQDSKCSWLIVQALERANDKQRKTLRDNYGRWDDAKVAKVKQVYNELDLEAVFKKYEEESYKAIQTELDKVTVMPRDVFELLLKKIYKRDK